MIRMNECGFIGPEGKRKGKEEMEKLQKKKGSKRRKEGKKERSKRRSVERDRKHKRANKNKQEQKWGRNLLQSCPIITISKYLIFRNVQPVQQSALHLRNN